jgi:hypothetical protein
VREPAVAAARAAGLDGRRAGVEADDARFPVGRHSLSKSLLGYGSAQADDRGVLLCAFFGSQTACRSPHTRPSPSPSSGRGNMAWQPPVVWAVALPVSARPEDGAGAVASSSQHALRCGSSPRGSRFPEAKAPDRSSRPRRNQGYGCHDCHCCHCGGRAGQSRRHDQEGGVSIVGEAGPRRGRQDHCHQDCCSGSATRRAPGEYEHSRRSVVCTPLCSANAVRIFAAHAHTCRLVVKSAHARTSGAHAIRNDVPSHERFGPCPPSPDRHARSHRQHRLYACGEFEDSA